MLLRLRRLAVPALVVAGAIYVACAGFGVQTMGDYPRLFASSTNALLAGHLGLFFRELPEDAAGGSVLLRAPAALLAKLLFGGQLAIFRFGALESVLALGGVGLWLARGMRASGGSVLARAAVVGLCVIAPALLDAILFGHPEEALGAALCVAAVLLADGEHPAIAGVALGLAIINKPWGIFAIAPTLLAARHGRVLIATLAVAITGAWLATAHLVAPGHFAHSLNALTSVVHSQELWWPLAHLASSPGLTPAYALPAFIGAHARGLVVLAAAALAVPLARRPARTAEDCLALLALVFLLRCMLDPSDHVYYHLPFVIALLAWESRARGAPILALLATGLLWLVFHTVSGVAGLDVQFLAYTAVTVPFVVVLARTALGRTASRRDALPAQPAAAL
jgi:hypothetical protein